ncbi:uncharacterized protein LOC131311683 isoform X2 [Rhododendron vialii]|uniref:uncharacterized protein LOC131311683 isoform X2 n=1 Tax=Rhododendron vialii TaxID=182163 RepID=UPI00265DBFE2|nr:uncharacterized protein LOC131311683 isoform X2 [Rhododendron vialii]
MCVSHFGLKRTHEVPKTYRRSTLAVPEDTKSTRYDFAVPTPCTLQFAGMVRKTMFDKAFDFVDRVVQPALTMAFFFTLALGVACDISAKRREERLNGYDYEKRLDGQA